MVKDGENYTDYKRRTQLKNLGYSFQDGANLDIIPLSHSTSNTGVNQPIPVKSGKFPATICARL